jgi:RTX calcium-binding nonapeptide repeat (4 copies)/WD40-like Beta Propeller Repeat
MLAPAAHAAFPGSDGKVAFNRSAMSAPDALFTVDPSGSLGPVPLLSDSAHNSFAPAWSPDGSRLVFVQNTSAGDPPYTLNVMNADGTGLRPLFSDSSGFVSDPAWSPDGRHVVFAATQAPAGLYVKDVDSSAPAVSLSGTGNYFEPAWSPDGTKIAVAVDPNQLGTINPDGSGFHLLDTAPSGGQTDRNPAWSPDGSTIYFDRGTIPTGCNSAAQIFSVPAGGGSVTTISRDPSVSEYDAAPSPAGDAIAFVRCDDPTNFLDHIWVAAPDGSGAHALTSGSDNFDDDPDWQPSAPRFASPPSISGNAVNNATLAATAGSSPGGGSTTLQFERCDAHGANCAAIPGAAASRLHAAAASASYKLTSADLGHTIRVRQVQTNGLGSAATDSAPTGSVVPSPGHCSNRFAGTAKADRINGSSGSDRIVGGAGRDKLFGLGGADCISGGAGNDTISGGKGNDTLSGGAGIDKITAGPGRNKVSGGAGNDAINVRNHKRDVVNCGPGKKDRVVADKIDKLHGCERVKRKK